MKYYDEILEIRMALKIKEFWDEQAEKYGSDLSAVNFDPNMELISTWAILEHLGNPTSILDLGCGNGSLTKRLMVQSERVVGCDFSEKMIQVCKARQDVTGVNFHVSDITMDVPNEGPYEAVVGRRVLINVGGEWNRKAALKNIAASLESGGRYFMVECFKGPLKAINSLRSSAGLPPIEVKWHNEYLDIDQVLFECRQVGLYCRQIFNYGSGYYFVSRVLNAALGNTDYNSTLNQVAMKVSEEMDIMLPALAPERLLIFVKE